MRKLTRLFALMLALTMLLALCPRWQKNPQIPLASRTTR